MKKLFLCLAGAAAALTLNAKVWRVNYDENAKADFKTIKEACATTLVSDGDTLYMEPGVHKGSYNDNTISRPLTIFGPGWGFQANNGAISSVPTATFSSSVYVRSSDVRVIGLNVLGTIDLDLRTSSAQNVVIERCRITGNMQIYSRTATSNFIIRNNICAYMNFYADILLTNIIIENNIVLSTNSSNTTYGISAYASSSYNGNSIFVRHNTIFGSAPQTNGSVIVYDNILFSQYAIKVNQTYDQYKFYNNVLAISQEQYDADQTSVSPVGYSNYADNIFAGATFANTCTDSIAGIYFDDAMRYQVRSDSPAKNAATDGTDCGAFGGEHPFVLYGRPEGIPYIYDVEVPAYPTDNKLNISFKVAGQNE